MAQLVIPPSLVVSGLLACGGTTIVDGATSGVGGDVGATPTSSTAATSTGTGGASPIGKCGGEPGWRLVTPPDEPMTFPTHGGWAGDELLIWSGASRAGYLFDPATERWTTMAPVPEGALDGITFGDFAAGRFYAFNHAGAAAFDWATNTWTPTAKWDGPKLATDPILDDVGAGVGADQHVVFLNWLPEPTFAGGVYDVGADAWIPLSDDSPPAAEGAFVAWTGIELLLWGGHEVATGNATDAGWRFDPSATSWSSLSSAGAPPPAAHGVTVWTGSRLFVWGGVDSDSQELTTGGLYDPRRDVWTSIDPRGAPPFGAFSLGALSGTDIYVGSRNAGDDGYGIYHLATDSWSSLDRPRTDDFLDVLTSDGCRVYAFFVHPSELWIYEPALDT